MIAAPGSVRMGRSLVTMGFGRSYGSRVRCSMRRGSGGSSGVGLSSAQDGINEAVGLAIAQQVVRKHLS